jgi:predicted dehydrogenase
MSDDLPVSGANLPPSPLDVGTVRNGRVTFPNWRGDADPPEPEPPAPLPPDERIGFAIMGLGRLALGQILPAFAQCRLARPVALISGDVEKARVVAAQYGIPPDAMYGYDEFDRLSRNDAVRAVYVVTPNGLHREHVRAVAATGRHVLCEKPMANTSDEARAMVADCAAAGVKLMIAYRCQYEPYNRELAEQVQSGRFGRPRLVLATNTQVQGAADQWRHKPALAGGGALPDIGLYCLNGVRTVLGEEPLEVFAQMVRGDERIGELDETIAFMLRFPSGAIAQCSASYAAYETKDLRLYSEDGALELENAFAYTGQRLFTRHRLGDARGVEETRLAHASAFAQEIDHFADAILHDRAPQTPGEEGVRDHLLMEAIYRAAGLGHPVDVSDISI